MKSEVTIRFAGGKDAMLLAELGRETFHDAFAGHPLMPAGDLETYLDEAFSVSQMTAELLDPPATFLIAEIAGEPAGYAKLLTGGRDPHLTASNPVKLKRLYSKQKFIGQGIGAVLLSHCIRESAGRKHDTIWLTVWEHNRRAQNFYHKWNFVPCGSIDFRLGQSILTDIVMQRAIQGA